MCSLCTRFSPRGRQASWPSLGKEVTSLPLPTSLYVKPLGSAEVHWPIKMVSVHFGSFPLQGLATQEGYLLDKKLKYPNASDQARKWSVWLSGEQHSCLWLYLSRNGEQRRSSTRGRNAMQEGKPALAYEQTQGANSFSKWSLSSWLSLLKLLPLASVASFARYACSFIAKPPYFSFPKPNPIVSHLLQLESFCIIHTCLVQWCFPVPKHKTEDHINIWNTD